jgi:hypothetical protein
MANSQLPVPPLAATGEQLAEARVGLKAQRDESVKRIEDRKRQVNQLAYDVVYILSTTIYLLSAGSSKKAAIHQIASRLFYFGSKLLAKRLAVNILCAGESHRVGPNCATSWPILAAILG